MIAAHCNHVLAAKEVEDLIDFAVVTYKITETEKEVGIGEDRLNRLDRCVVRVNVSQNDCSHAQGR